MFKFRTIYLVLIFSFLFQISFSQSKNNSNSVYGNLIDSTSSSPLSLATIAVYNSTDSSIIDFRMSNFKGDFRIPNLPINKNLRIIISYSGYVSFKYQFKLKDSLSNIDLGKIRLVQTFNKLDDIVIQSERPPIIVRKDTIEFNATSFKTLPTSFVEDLLKKLPGVNIDGDGNINYNGKSVNKILVNGKEFFGGNTRLATRNLPANIIDKIQVINDIDEINANPDKSINSLGKVINLTLKKGLNKGLFGKAYGGLGNNDHYESGALLNIFRDTLQVNLVGYTNNLNRASFGLSDLRTLGGFNRSGINSISSNNSGITVNDISFGGTGEGIQTAYGAGININNVFKNGLTLNTQFFYGDTKNIVDENITRDQYFGNDTVLNYISSRKETILANSNKLSFTLKFNINPKIKFDFRPNITFTNLNSNRNELVENYFKNTSILSTSINSQFQNAKSTSYAHTLNITKTFSKKGQTLNLYQLLNLDDISRNQYNLINEIYLPSSSKSIDQLRYRIQNNISISTLVTFNTPISKSSKFKIIYNLLFGNGKDTLNTYSKNPANNSYDILNQTLSNAFRRNSIKNSLTSSWIKNIKDLSLSVGVTFTALNLLNDFRFNQGNENKKYFNVFPVINIDWKEFSFSYNKSLVPPSITELQIVPDNTNSLNNILGNPLLKPSFVNNFSINYFKNIPSKSMYINLYFNGYFYEDGITRVKTIDQNGYQTSLPINSDYLQNYFTFLTINKQVKFKNKSSLNFTSGYNFNFNQSYLQINKEQSVVKIYNIAPYLRFGYNANDIYELNFAIKPEFNFTRYTNYFENKNVSRLILNSEFVLRWPKNFVIESSYDYKQISQTSTDNRKYVSLLNAGITYVFLKQKKGQLKFYWYDILNQNISISRIASDNIITERIGNVLTRYFLVTFSYNISSFKTEKVGGRSSLFLF